jgi:hypothetical protein
MEELYAVVTTFVARGGDGLPTGRVETHTYGPYARGQAARVRRELLDQRPDARLGDLTVVATKLLDPERRTPFAWARTATRVVASTSHT